MANSNIPRVNCQTGIRPEDASIIPKIPTKPLVPIPPPEALHLNIKTVVDNGPTIMLATIWGIKILGFLIKFGICNMLVPRPCAINPPHLFSLKLDTAKPTICAQQPTQAAPPAINIASELGDTAAMEIQIAAEEVGSVKSNPIVVEITIPIKKGVAATEISIPFAIRSINFIKGHAGFLS